MLDLITVAKYFDSPSRAAVGNDYYFTSGRYPRPGESWDELMLKAPGPMPAGTSFHDQIPLRNRLVGFTLSLNGDDWKIVRDSDPPRIVTDTFDDARQEWPNRLLSRDEMPKVTVCVQRPIFRVDEHAGKLPAVGEWSITSLSQDVRLIIRTLNNK